MGVPLSLDGVAMLPPIADGMPPSLSPLPRNMPQIVNIRGKIEQ